MRYTLHDRRPILVVRLVAWRGALFACELHRTPDKVHAGANTHTEFTKYANNVKKSDVFVYRGSRIKVVVFLLGDEDKMLKVWKVGGLAECQLELVHTQSKKQSLLSHSDV